MANVKISAMTAKGSVDGTELFAVADGANPRSVTGANIKSYVVDQIEAISAGSTVEAADKVYILDATDSALKPMAIGTVGQYQTDVMWAKAAEASPDDADVMLLKDGGTTEKTVLLSVLAEYVRATIEAAILDVSDLADGSGAIATSDYMLVTQGTTGKRIQISDLSTLIYASLASGVEALTGLSPAATGDWLYITRSGTGYKISIDNLATYIASTTTLSGSGAAGYLAQWNDSTTLEQGPAIVESGTGFAAGAETEVPTTACVRGEMDTIINDATAIGAALAATDTFLVDDGANGTQRKSAISRIKDYVETVGTYKTIWLPASMWYTKTTNGAAAVTTNEKGATNDINLKYHAFDGGATEEGIQTVIPMPEDWDLGTIKAKFFWTSAASSTAGDTVEWALKAGALTDNDAIDAALGTEQVITDTLLANDGADLQLTSATPAITVGGTPALADLLVMEVFRNTDGTDDMVEDAWLLGVWIQYQATAQPAAW